MAEEAKALVRGLVARHAIACDLRPGIIHAAHRAAYVAEYHAEAEKLARDYGYERDRAARPRRPPRAPRQPGLPRRRARPRRRAPSPAELRPRPRAGRRGGRGADLRGQPGHAIGTGAAEVRTAAGGCGRASSSLAGNGYLGGLAPAVAARVMPINNFIVATAPLGEERARGLIRNEAAVADSRFVVNYFRLSADRRLLFGGGESYGWRFPADIAGLVRPRMVAVFPQLAACAIDHAWGGTLAITVNRMPAFQRLGPAALSVADTPGTGWRWRRWRGS